MVLVKINYIRQVSNKYHHLQPDVAMENLSNGGKINLLNDQQMKENIFLAPVLLLF